jgi:hypothetical protein
MDWISLHHYGLILQQERLRRAREWRARISVPRVYKWLRAVRSRRVPRAHGDRAPARIRQAGRPALPTDGAPA